MDIHTNTKILNSIILFSIIGIGVLFGYRDVSERIYKANAPTPSPTSIEKKSQFDSIELGSINGFMKSIQAKEPDAKIVDCDNQYIPASSKILTYEGTINGEPITYITQLERTDSSIEFISTDSAQTIATMTCREDGIYGLPINLSQIPQDYLDAIHLIPQTESEWKSDLGLVTLNHSLTEKGTSRIDNRTYTTHAVETTIGKNPIIEDSLNTPILTYELGEGIGITSIKLHLPQSELSIQLKSIDEVSSN